VSLDPLAVRTANLDLEEILVNGRFVDPIAASKLPARPLPGWPADDLFRKRARSPRYMMTNRARRRARLGCRRTASRGAVRQVINR